MNDLLIGYGHPLRGDDRIGHILAETLGAEETTITCIQLTPELSEPISRARRVVFFDARVGDDAGAVAAGAVVVETVTPMESHSAFVHHVTPSSLLAMAETLYGASPPAVLISVTAASFDHSTTLSPQITAAFPQILETVSAAMKTFLEDG